MYTLLCPFVVTLHSTTALLTNVDTARRLLRQGGELWMLQAAKRVLVQPISDVIYIILLLKQ